MLMLYWKKLNFDLATPSPGSGEVGEGKVNTFSVMLGHPTLYWASLPYFPTDHKSQNHQESMLGFVELYFFFLSSFVMFYDSVTKYVRNSYEYSRDSSGFGLRAEFTTMYNNPINKLKNRSRIS